MALRLAAAVALAAYASRALAVALPSPPPSPPPDTLDDGSPASVTVECNNAVLAGGRVRALAGAGEWIPPFAYAQPISRSLQAHGEFLQFHRLGNSAGNSREQRCVAQTRCSN